MNICVMNVKHKDLSIDRFKEIGTVSTGSNETDEELMACKDDLAKAEAIYFASFKLQTKMLELCPHLKVVCCASTGYDWIRPDVLEYTKKHGIAICNNPVYGSAAVAQHGFALLMELTNLVGLHDASLRRGEWDGHRDFWVKPLTEMTGKTMGIIGMGNIGAKMAKMAHGFEMKVLTYSEVIKDEVKDIVEAVSLEELLGRSDFISLNCPLFDSTREMINAKTIAQMKDGAFLVNSARGGLINEQDVADALKSGKMGGYGADAFTVEPIKMDNPLLSAPNCILTPHIAWSSRDSRQRQLDNGAETIRSFFAGKPVNVINA